MFKEIHHEVSRICSMEHAILGVDSSLILLHNCNVAAAGPVSPVAGPGRAGVGPGLPSLDTHSLSENWRLAVGWAGLGREGAGAVS